MSRKQHFEQYILKSTSVKDIRAAGQGEDGRVVRAGILVAARVGNAAALKALFPLVDVNVVFLNEVITCITGHSNAGDLLSALPSNLVVPTYPMERSVYGFSDDIQSQLVRIYDVNEGLWTFAHSAASQNYMKTLEAVLKKNKNKHFISTLLSERWHHYSPQVCKYLIAQSKDLVGVLGYLQKNPTPPHHMLVSQDNKTKYDCVIQWLEDEQAQRLRATLVEHVPLTSNTPTLGRKRKM